MKFTVNDLTDAQKNQYLPVEKYLSKNPGASVSEACSSTGSTKSTFYSIRKMVETGIKPLSRKERESSEIRPYKKRVKMFTLPVEEVSNSNDHVVAFVGSSKSVVQSVREYLRS